MSKNIGTEISFQEKFKDRSENMGKNGVLGIMKTTDNPINRTEGANNMDNWNRMYNNDFAPNKYKKKEESSFLSGRRESSKIGNSGLMVMNNNLGNNNNYAPAGMNNLYANYPMMQMPQMSMMNYGPGYGPMMPMMNYNPYAMPMGMPGMNPMYAPNLDNLNRNLFQNNMMTNNYHGVPYPPIDAQQQPIKLLGAVHNTNSNFNYNQGLPKFTNQLNDPGTHLNNSKHSIINNSATNNSTHNEYLPNQHRNHSSGGSKSKIIEGDYQPYTLKDYKELTRANIILGSLGPNIGTKDWEEKMEKMKKMTDYASQINQVKKGIMRLKKETPQDDIEKDKKTKIESSTRFKSYEYGKLVRPKPKTSVHPDIYSQDLGIIEENEEQQFNHIFEEAKGGNHTGTNMNMRYGVSGSKSKRSDDDFELKKNSAKEEYDELTKLQKQRETYEAKIIEIKQSLLK